VQPICDHDAERSVVACILVAPRVLAEVAALVEPGDFSHPALRAVYEAMQSLDASSNPIDALTVAAEMRALGTFDMLRAFDGAQYLGDIMSEIVTVENASYYAGIVARKAERRRWAESFRELVASAHGGGDDDAWFESAESAVLSLTAATKREADVVPLKAALHEFADELGARVKRKKDGGSSLIGVTTGYERLDSLLSGLRKGALYLFAARPGMGKSALAMNFVERSATAGTAWLVFSLEMSSLELAQRMVSGRARIDGQRLAQGDVQGAPEWLRITGATSALSELPVWLSTRADLTIDQIRAAARRWRMGKGRKFENVGVVVDYLQLVRAMQKRRQQNREQDVSEISRGCKLLARQLDCPVVALAQLNRGPDQRTDHRPVMADLRESGALEQDADVVAFVYRDGVYHDPDDCTQVGCSQCERRDVAEVIVSKQRGGPTGTIDLLWQGPWTRFEPLAARSDT